MKRDLRKGTEKVLNSKLMHLFGRRSIRRYTGEAIPREMLEQLLQAGMAAPSASNHRPWHITVITDRQLLNQLADANPYGKMLPNAAAAFLVSGDSRRMYVGEGRDFWVEDCAAMTENILLAAHALGYGAVWIGQHPLAERKQSDKLILNLPDYLEPMSLIAIGIPAESKEARTQYEAEQVLWKE